MQTISAWKDGRCSHPMDRTIPTAIQMVDQVAGAHSSDAPGVDLVDRPSRHFLVIEGLYPHEHRYDGISKKQAWVILNDLSPATAGAVFFPQADSVLESERPKIDRVNERPNLRPNSRKRPP